MKCFARVSLAVLVAMVAVCVAAWVGLGVACDPPHDQECVSLLAADALSQHDLNYSAMVDSKAAHDTFVLDHSCLVLYYGSMEESYGYNAMAYYHLQEAGTRNSAAETDWNTQKVNHGATDTEPPNYEYSGGHYYYYMGGQPGDWTTKHDYFDYAIVMWGTSGFDDLETRWSTGGSVRSPDERADLHIQFANENQRWPTSHAECGCPGAD